MVVQRHSHLGFFNIQNEGFSYAPALNASLIQFLLCRLHPIGGNVPIGRQFPGAQTRDLEERRGRQDSDCDFSDPFPLNTSLQTLFRISRTFYSIEESEKLRFRTFDQYISTANECTLK